MDDDQEMLPEFGAYNRTGFESNIHASTLLNYKNREYALRVIEAIARTVAATFAQAHVSMDEINNFLNDVARLSFPQFKSPIGLFFGWLAQLRSFEQMKQLIQKINQWPDNIEKITPIELLRYQRYWQQLTV